MSITPVSHPGPLSGRPSLPLRSGYRRIDNRLATMPALAQRRSLRPRPPGLFTVDLDGAAIGQVILRRATIGPQGPPAASGKAELGYMFLPEAWGFGYAAEACTAALGWLDDTFPGEPVVLFTQTANARSMRLAAKLGSTEVRRYEASGAEQWFGMRSPVTPSD